MFVYQKDAIRPSTLRGFVGSEGLRVSGLLTIDTVNKSCEGPGLKDKGSRESFCPCSCATPNTANAFTTTNHDYCHMQAKSRVNAQFNVV